MDNVLAVLSGKNGQARLLMNGQWQSDDEELAAMLNTSFPAYRHPPSPAEHTPRQFQAQAAARDMGMKIEWIFKDDGEYEPGVVY